MFKFQNPTKVVIEACNSPSRSMSRSRTYSLLSLKAVLPRSWMRSGPCTRCAGRSTSGRRKEIRLVRCNFYWRVEHQEPRDVTLPTGETTYLSSGLEYDDPTYHLGLRSPAGLYCWGCKETLGIQGPSAVHFGQARFHPACPKCHKSTEDNYRTRFERIDKGSGGGSQQEPSGVTLCYSFTWAQDPDRAIKVLLSRENEVLVEDEYGRTYTGADFIRMLQLTCPIQHRNSIGQRFS